MNRYSQGITGKQARALGVLLLAGSFLSLFSSCQKQQAPVSEGKSAFCISTRLKEKISIQTAQMEPVTESKMLSGMVEYNPDRVVHYTSLVEGVITNTYFTLGERVKKGQVLAEIRSTELTSLQAERTALESRIKVTARNVSSVREMYEDGIASEKDLLEAQSDESAAMAELNRIKSNLALFSASQERDVFQIKAPVSGFVVSKNISAGMQISDSSEPLFTISDLDEVWVTANLYARDLADVREGMDVIIQTSAYGNESFNGTIQAIPQVFDAQQRVIKARIAMDNTDLRLKPGMFVNVVVKKSTTEEAIRIPQKAMIFNANRNFVVLYEDDCAVRLQEVSVLRQDEGNIFIGEGLKPGEQYIAQNHLLIYEALQNFKN